MIIRIKKVAIYAAVLLLAIACNCSIAGAITVPEIKVDPSSYKYSSASSAYITGRVSPAAGQNLKLYSSNKKRVLLTVYISKDGDGRFRIKVPEKSIGSKHATTLYLKSTASKGVSASKYVAVRLESATGKSATKATTRPIATKVASKPTTKKPASKAATKKSPTTKKPTSKSSAKSPAATNKPATKKATYTSFKIIYYGNDGTFGNNKRYFTSTSRTGTSTVIAANKFKRSGYEFVGWATNTSRGWLTGGITNRKAHGKVDRKRFQLGVVAFKAKSRVSTNKLYSTRSSKKIVQLHAVWKGKGPQAAVDWACVHAADNSFAYGKSGYWHGKKGRREHCHGCYYCGTNRKKWNGSYRYKEAKPGSRWDRTYCCNPFVSAAYTHGANHQSTCIFGNMDYSSWTATNNSHGRFKRMGRIGSSKLKAGDILFNGTHVWMYAGNGYRVEAAESSWGANSIRAKKGVGAGGASGVIRYVSR